jgi:Pyridoxamine 5'-phosphate oxidase
MQQHEIVDELGQAGAQDLLERATLLRLAYNGDDALPRVIPIGFFWDGEAIVMCTAVTSPKVSALKSRPEVALTIDTGATPADARSLLVRGEAEIDIIDGIPAEYLAASRKTLDEPAANDFEAQVAQMYEQMARIRVVPAWARFYDFGAGRFPRFLRELAES